MNVQELLRYLEHRPVWEEVRLLASCCYDEHDIGIAHRSNGTVIIYDAESITFDDGFETSTTETSTTETSSE